MPHTESKVIDLDLRDLLIEHAIKEIDSFSLCGIDNTMLEAATRQNLPYESDKVFEYAQNYCGGGNDCPDGSFELDCTHFICHCLFATGARIDNPSAKCRRGLGIRVNDLAAAFNNAVDKFGNVKRISSHSQTQRGDFCFIPGWFGLSKEHVMLLAGTASATEARVYAHSRNHCGRIVPFDGEDCVYYRIEDYSG